MSCEADQLGYAPCKHPPKWKAVRWRRDADGRPFKRLLCGYHAAPLRRLPTWSVTELEPTDV